MRVGLTYNVKFEVDNLEPSRPRSEDMYEEFDSPETIKAICAVLEGMDHECVKLGYGRSAVSKLINNGIDFVFNIAEGYCGRSREAHIPALLEMLHVPHSGPDPFTAALSLDKISAKKLAAYAGATTPAHYVVLPDKEINLQVVRFPVIVKPAYEGSSIGIRQDSKVFNLPELEKKITWLRANYPSQPVIIEQFISGREFTVGITGNNTPKVLGVMEIVPIKKALKDFIYSLEVKRNYLEEVEYICPPNLSEAMMQELTRVAIHLFNNFGCRDIARFDFRIDDYGTPYFLEVNTLPGLHPVSSDIVIMARAMGIEYDQLIKKIFNTAFARYN